MSRIEKISRRRLFESAAVIAAAASLGGSGAIAQAEVKEEDKISQKDAQYQNHPKGQQRCEICLQFQAPNKCKIVRGPITSQGWCQYFAARENAR